MKSGSFAVICAINWLISLSTQQIFLSSPKHARSKQQSRIHIAMLCIRFHTRALCQGCLSNFLVAFFLVFCFHAYMRLNGIITVSGSEIITSMSWSRDEAKTKPRRSRTEFRADKDNGIQAGAHDKQWIKPFFSSTHTRRSGRAKMLAKIVIMNEPLTLDDIPKCGLSRRLNRRDNAAAPTCRQCDASSDFAEAACICEVKENWPSQKVMRNASDQSKERRYGV